MTIIPMSLYEILNLILTIVLVLITYRNYKANDKQQKNKPPTG